MSGASWAPVAQSGEKISVRVSELLSVLIAISGITVPLLLAYLLIKEKDLQISISEKAIFYLNQNGIMLSSFRSAILTFSDPLSKDQPSDGLKSLHEFVGLGSHEAGESLSENAQAWLLPEDKLRKCYNSYFSDGQERSALKICMLVVGTPAVFCFLDMYARYYGLNGWPLDIFEQFLILFTGIVNVSAYLIVLRIISLKGAIRRQANKEVKKVCSQVKAEIAAVVSNSEQLGRNLGAELKRETEIAEGR